MARFFQHLSDGDNLGKVTRLKYIDDITDDEMTLYYFTDGTKCNSEFIAEVNDPEPQKTNMYMVEITSPTNKWKFEKKLIIPEESSVMTAKDGIAYEAPSPDVKLNGTKDGVESGAKQGVRIDSHPPKPVPNYVPEDDMIYLLSEHPERESLEDDAQEPTSATKSSGSKKASPFASIIKNKPVDNSIFEESDEDDFIFDEEEPKQTVQKITSNTKQTVKKTVEQPPQPVQKQKSNSLFIDLDNMSGVEKITVVRNGQAEVISVQEYIDRMSVTSEEHKKAISENSEQEIDEDILIKSMIDKSTMKPCKITMAMSIPLPPKEVYETIKSFYDDENGNLTKQFVNSLTARIKREKLLNSFAVGLANYYDSAKKINKTETVKEQV